MCGGVDGRVVVLAVKRRNAKLHELLDILAEVLYTAIHDIIRWLVLKSKSFLPYARIHRENVVGFHNTCRTSVAMAYESSRTARFGFYYQ